MTRAQTAKTPTQIDRRALVDRHDVVLTEIDPHSPLGIGNGNFAITVDATGLQSLPAAYPVGPRDPSRPEGTLLGTLSTWGWHSDPAAAEFGWRDSLVKYDSARGPVPYVDMEGAVTGGTEVGSGNRDLLLRGNPHRLDLGTLGFRLQGEPLTPGSVRAIHQKLSLFTGSLRSVWELIGAGEQPVRVEVDTLCDPSRDLVAVRIRSQALITGLSVGLTFSYGSADWHSAQDWDAPDRHRTTSTAEPDGSWRIERVLDATSYLARLTADGPVTPRGPHELDISASGPELTVVAGFWPDSAEPAEASGTASEPRLPSFEEVRADSSSHWERFWRSGAAIELGAADDPRAHELERRIVLSQFLTAVHCAGDMPPQETGLVCNSWRGKSHLEMHWWHAAHFPLWGRADLLVRSVQWYRSILPLAREMAGVQGFDGARWPKQVGPDGEETPSGIGPFLIWQQPHPIHLAELIRRAEGDGVVGELDDLVTATADFMASFAQRTDRGFELPPPLIPAQESYGGIRKEVRNPTFELVYWHWALGIACDWKQRQGLDVPPLWAEVRDGIVPPAPRDGVYPAIDGAPWTIRKDHPSMLCALGMLPSTRLIDPQVMLATLDDVLAEWDWSTTWGWDYPVMAMTAARLGLRDRAVDLLLTDTGKNEFLTNGHNRQTGSLPLYLPGNGGLLMTIALMAGGWDGADPAGGDCTGFPRAWNVRAEGFVRAP